MDIAFVLGDAAYDSKDVRKAAGRLGSYMITPINKRNEARKDVYARVMPAFLETALGDLLFDQRNKVERLFHILKDKGLENPRMFGMSLVMMPIFTAGLNELALSLNKYGTAMVNTLRMIAGAVGMAFFVSIMTNRGAKHVKEILMQHHILPTDKTHMPMAVNQGAVMGINDAFMVATWLTVGAFMLSFFIRRTSPKEDTITNRVKKSSKEPVLQ
ncbi:hypothetical protein ACFOU2_08140 [Bacillus songklensis]|uniref:Uncharacterized protein n=1 Tax=Bacillus songklensis TaxID=1069116 RepID=A0ABV8AZQ7_9BACI